MILIKNLSFFLDKKYKFKFFSITFLIFIGIILETFSIGSFIPLLNFIVKGKEYFLQNSFIQKNNHLSNFFENNSEKEIILIFLISLILLFILKNLFLIFLSWKKESFNFNLRSNLSSKLFKGFLLRDYKNFYNKNSSDYFSLILNQVSVLVEGINQFIFFINEILLFLFLFLLLVYVEPQGSLYIVFFLLSLMFINLFFNRKVIKKWSQIKFDKDKLQIKSISEGFQLFSYLKVLSLEKLFSNTFSENNKKVNEASKIQMFVNTIPKHLFEISMIIVLSILMLAVLSKDQEIINTIPILGIFILTAIRLLPSFSRLLISIQNIKFSYPAVKTLKEELANMNNQKMQENQITLFKKKISISNLGFSYENKTIFNNLNFEILKGEKIGIKGETGSGKTSLVNILLGLIDINKGKIVLDDQDMTNSKLYKKIKIGYVPQSIFLIDDSIKQNIVLNNQTNIDEHLLEVIKMSCLTDFTNSLPKKTLTHIGEHANKISGGQKQRIGIARALFTKPDILILDEATNALDGVTEDTILNNIINKSKDLTVIVISHRDSSLDKCDKIFEITSKDLKRLK
tara:strand:- start:6435 stop:8150 length:1716 start_codon:yes stop_codon:yes gene_type:complete